MTKDRGRRWRLWAGLACLVSTVLAVSTVAAVPGGSAMAATVEGEALYRERTGPVAADPCAHASTQAALNECAFQGFLAASAAMSEQLRGIEAALTPARRPLWRRAQKAWLAYRTQTCQFEASAVGEGSARPMVQWQCADRLTRQRTAELSRLAACPEGDIDCPIRRR